MLRRIAVLTSGDNTPGLNAAIRAVTRMALDCGLEVMGVRNGYAGLIGGEFSPLTARIVGGIIHRGGTVLGSVESQEFLTEDGRRNALNHLAEHNIDALVVIGGDGSQAGAYALSQMGFQVNGVATSIDNDLAGSEITIGVDTALNVALESIDRLKRTASSTCYAFLVEVAGRKFGYLALMTGIAGGAEAIVIPEVETTPEQILDAIENSYERGKRQSVVVVAEGATHNVDKLKYHVLQSEPSGFELRAMSVCQIQRGGSPSAFDRLLGTRLGSCAVEALTRGESGVLAGLVGGAVRTTPLSEVVGKTKRLDPDLIRLSDVMAL